MGLTLSQSNPRLQLRAFIPPTPLTPASRPRAPSPDEIACLEHCGAPQDGILALPPVPFTEKYAKPHAPAAGTSKRALQKSSGTDGGFTPSPPNQMPLGIPVGAHKAPCIAAAPPSQTHPLCHAAAVVPLETEASLCKVAGAVREAEALGQYRDGPRKRKPTHKPSVVRQKDLDGKVTGDRKSRANLAQCLKETTDGLAYRLSLASSALKASSSTFAHGCRTLDPTPAPDTSGPRARGLPTARSPSQRILRALWAQPVQTTTALKTSGDTELSTCAAGGDSEHDRS
ncbi:hypothetical protein EV363DRAFT_1458403 [Boletus edulis]|nr:hypothetical protein EV363DRAFT_1458403 [Boletus edulis]